MLVISAHKAAFAWTAGHDSPCKSSYACRMDAVERRLEELNREVNDLTVKIGIAQDNWLRAQDAQDKAYLEKVYEDLKGEKHLLNTRRAKLEEKLLSLGEHNVQTAAAKAALAAAGTSAQKRPSDTWPWQYGSSRYLEDAVPAKYILQHSVADPDSFHFAPPIAPLCLIRVSLSAGLETRSQIAEGEDRG